MRCSIPARTALISSVDPVSISDLDHEDDHHIILDRENDPLPPDPMRVNRNTLVPLQFSDV